VYGVVEVTVFWVILIRVRIRKCKAGGLEIAINDQAEPGQIARAQL
jgi:hypothetical protein